MNIKNWILAAAVVFLAHSSSLVAQSKDELVGTWKLVSAVDTTDKGEIVYRYGHKPVGFLTYTADGRMMAIISHEGRKPLSVPDYISAPAGERAEAFATFGAYAGRYTLQGNEVTHHVEVASLQNRVNTDLIRTIVSLTDNRLILRAPATRNGGKMVTTELIWERISEGTSGATH